MQKVAEVMVGAQEIAKDMSRPNIPGIAGNIGKEIIPHGDYYTALVGVLSLQRVLTVSQELSDQGVTNRNTFSAVVLFYSIEILTHITRFVISIDQTLVFYYYYTVYINNTYFVCNYFDCV